MILLNSLNSLSTKKVCLIRLNLIANGIDIDNWTFDELIDVVEEFKRNVGEHGENS